MNISSTPFIRNDYWPDYNDIDILNKRIDEAENETSLVNSRLTNDIENVSNNLNSYKNEMADTVITNNIIVNNLNANYVVGKYANFANTNTDNAYIENLTVNKPVFDLTLNTPHVENITSIGGNFYDANMFNVAVDNLIVNTSSEPVTSSAVLGYDSEGRVIPIHAAFEVGFPENANYLFTDQHGTAFPGTAETEVNASDNLITSYAVYNAIANVNNSFNNVNEFVNNGFNNVNIFVNNGFNNVSNSFNAVNNTANNLLDNVDYLKTTLAPLLSLPVANVSGWVNSTTPVNIQGITSFVVVPFAAPVTTGSDVGDGAKLNVSGTTATLALPGFQWTMESMNNAFTDCTVFNQNIQIPDGVTSMVSTFSGCKNFNQNILIPNSVTSIDNTFSRCRMLNQNIQIPNSVTRIYCTFANCNNLNQNIQIPDSVTNMTGAFGGCDNLNQNIQIPDSVTDMTDAFRACFNLNQNILIPNSVTEIDMTFTQCGSFNQNILIPNSVTTMARAFYYCDNLNQPNMYIFSQNIAGMAGIVDTFKGCHINNIHIPTSVPKSTSNSMYNCLVNGATGITFPASNIFNDLPVDIEQWPPV